MLSVEEVRGWGWVRGLKVKGVELGLLARVHLEPYTHNKSSTPSWVILGGLGT